MKKILLLLLLPIITFAQKECVIHVTTDNYPTETYWTLFADSLYGDTIATVPAGYYTSPNTSYTDTCYINDSIADITFLMRDTYGDGMNGSYYVTVCGDTIVNKLLCTNINSNKLRSIPRRNFLGYKRYIRIYNNIRRSLRKCS